MNEDYAKATAAGVPVTIGGGEYRAAKFGPRSYGDLNAWLKKQKPVARMMATELSCRGLPDAVALQIWRDLQDEAQDWPLSLDHAEGNRLLTLTSEGAAQVVWVMLRKYQPHVTLEKAGEIAADITSEELNELIRLGLPEPTHDPKAETSLKDQAPTESPSVTKNSDADWQNFTGGHLTISTK